MKWNGFIQNHLCPAQDLNQIHPRFLMNIDLVK